MSTTRAKFKVHSVTQFEYPGTQVVLFPVVSGLNEENKKFWAATPSGKIEMTINTEAAAHFIPGEEVYVNFHFPTK